MMFRVFALSLLLLAAQLFSACREGEARAETDTRAQKTQSGQASTKPDAKVINVKVETLAPTDVVEEIAAHGITKPIREVTYSAEVPGKVEYLSAELGDRVRAGQVLARIDFRTLKAQADQSEAASSLARSTYERLAALKDEELVSQQQLDEAKSNMIGAEAGLEITKANLAKSSVRSELKGIVTAKYVEKGEYVGPGTRLYNIVDYHTIVVEAQLAETQVGSIRVGAKVDVQIDALGEQFEGVVDTILPTADKDSKTFTARVNIPNPDLKILVGMSAVLKITANKLDGVIAVSQSAVVDEGGESSVFIAEGNTAKKRAVKLGALEGDRVVVLEGVSAGEELITVGQRELSDNQPINVVR